MAYGIVALLRWKHNDSYATRRIFATSRIVSPSNEMSVPRKELNGLVLAAKKAVEFREEFHIEPTNVFLHSDSMICLYWLNKPLEKLAVYVHNRIKSIRDTGFHEQVFFTGSEENVADLVTKVKPPSAFIDNEFWNQGPAYLKEESWATGRSINEIHEKHKLSAGQNVEMEKETKKEAKLVNFTTIVRNELNHNMVCEVVLRSNNLHRVVWILRNCIKAAKA